MSQTFQVSITPGGQSQIIFPDNCVCCGAAKQTESALVINRLVLRGQRQLQISWNYPIPHCHQCARSTKAVFLASFIPFVLGVVLAGGAAFILVAFYATLLGLDNFGQPGNFNALVLGAFVGLVMGLIGGLLCELLARLLLLPLYGRALMQAPLLAMQFLNDSDYVAGLTGKPDQEARYLNLTFTNDEVAREFKRLNDSWLGSNS